MLNRIILIGRLTADPELRYTKSGIAVGSFTLAVDRRYKNADGERETDFIDVVVWRQLAETCHNYLGRGKLAAVAVPCKIRPMSQRRQQRKAAEVVARTCVSSRPRIAAAPPPAAEPRDSGPFYQSNDADYGRR